MGVFDEQLIFLDLPVFFAGKGELLETWLEAYVVEHSAQLSTLFSFCSS